MDKSESLNHSKWECKYHMIFIPKCRRKTLYDQLRPHLGEIFKRLAEYNYSRVEEGHLMPDHVHMHIDPAEACGVPGNWIHQGQECDSFGTSIRGSANATL